jgi:hypothetical protein
VTSYILDQVSSMNVLITLDGELELNSMHDDLDTTVTTKFVDELVSLGILLPAEGELHLLIVSCSV